MSVDTEYFQGRSVDEKISRRIVVFPWLLWAVVALGMILFPLVAKGETYSATDGGNKLTLYTEPCSLGSWFKDWKKASWVFQGQTFEACWRVMGQTVMTVDSAGDIGAIPMQAFKKDMGV